MSTRGLAAGPGREEDAMEKPEKADKVLGGAPPRPSRQTAAGEAIPLAARVRVPRAAARRPSRRQ